MNNNTNVMFHIWQTFDVGQDIILATADANGTAYYLQDANKNVIQKASFNGIIHENYSYAPYGTNMENIAAGISFSSEVFDYETSLSYYNYRYYIPLFGRWLSRDPIINIFEVKISGEQNLFFTTIFSDYLFIVNMIINKTDYLGLWPVHGNWCGPNWTGGFEKPWNQLTPHQKKHVKPPVDTVDGFCMNHDKMYGACENKYKNNECNYLKCLNKADDYLVNAIGDYLVNLEDGYDGDNISQSATIRYNKIMDAIDTQRIYREGEIKKKCKCKK